jgi:hypothetical protein
VPLSFSFAGLGLHQPNALTIGGVAGQRFTDGADGAEPEETTMLRKLSLVAVAAASLGVAALAPTSASAWGGHGWHGGWHGGWGGPRIFVGGPAYYGGYGYGGCYVRRLVPHAVGPALAPGKPLLLIPII